MIFKSYYYFCIYYLTSYGTSATSGECRDLKGRTIAQGMHYVPGPDSCTLCICDSGHPKWCKAVLCTPPQDCKSFRVGNTCCEFICLDDTLSKDDGSADSGADFGLRLIASAVIVGLTLSLIFVLVLRLRQRKLRGRQNRQLSEDERSLASIGYITGSLGYLPQSYHCAQDHIEFHYEEPPSHYPLWKPSGNFFPRGEAPPPYEEAVSQPRSEVTISSSNTLINMSHRTIPLNLATSGTIRIVDPNNTISIRSTQNTLQRERNNTAQEHNSEVLNRSHSNGNIIQCLDSNTICIVDNSNTIVRSDATTNSLRKNVNIVRCSDNATRNINSISLPRNSEMMRRDEDIIKRSSVLVNLPEESNKSNIRNSSSMFRYEININSSNISNISSENYFHSLRKSGTRSCNTTLRKHESLKIGAVNVDQGVSTSEAAENLTVGDIPPPLPESANEIDAHAIRSDVFYEDVFIGLPTTLNLDVNNHNSDITNGENNNNIISSANKETNVSKVNIPYDPNNDSSKLDNKEKSWSEQTLTEQDQSSCECSSYQCLTGETEDNDDYRSECENCKSAPGSSYFLDEDPEPPETMTLQRVPKELDEFENQEQYYRTSLTLPTHCRRPRSTPLQSGSSARENWFSSMPESGSSSEEE